MKLTNNGSYGELRISGETLRNEETRRDAEGFRIEFWKNGDYVYKPEFNLYITEKEAKELKKLLTKPKK